MTKNTALAVEDFPQEPWERTFPDPSAVYIFDNIHAPNVPHWTMVDPADLPINDPDGNYKLDVGPANSLMHKALFDLAIEVRRILPTARIKLAPRLYLPGDSGEMQLAKSSAVTEFDTRPERHGWFAVPTLLLSSNQSVEDAFREAYRFLWMLIEEEIPYLTNIPPSTMAEIEILSFTQTDAVVYDWLSKFPKDPSESRDNFLNRIAKERRALVFQNMAMSAKSGCWDDDQRQDPFRKTHDVMLRWAIRGTLGKLIKDEYGPVPDDQPAQPKRELDAEHFRRIMDQVMLEPNKEGDR